MQPSHELVCFFVHSIFILITCIPHSPGLQTSKPQKHSSHPPTNTTSQPLLNHLQMAPSVYLLLHKDTSGTPTIVSVFAELADANAACLASAAEAQVKTGVRSPRDLRRWEAPDGTTCWVEKHVVVPRKLASTLQRPASPKRNNSNLYDNDEDDVIELQDKEEHYD